MDEFKCPIHNLSRMDGCNWCGNPICKQCIEACDNKRYCPKCYSTLSKTSFAKRVATVWGEKPERKVTNFDPSLDKEEAKKIRQTLEVTKRAKKILGEY
jgi:hypothetical protein